MSTSTASSQKGQKGQNVRGCAPAGQGSGGGIRPSKSSPRRAAVLIAIHVLFLIHVTHWLVTGRTMALLEPSESMRTLELGEVNVGFIFFVLAILSTFIFGRLFCGWGCHIVALQDLCGWMMKKVGIRPKLFRTRFLVYVPLVMAFYMFAWPTVKREILFPLWPGATAIFRAVPPRPELTSHLTTAGFWDTMPPLAIGIPFLIVCGFATVYFLGAKGFCTYGCPYGGVFGVVDKVAVGKIVADLDACEGCAHCTAVCTSNVRVHEEIQVYSAVVNPGCMKCMDCVSVCPKGALSFGYSRPSVLRKPLKSKKKRIFDVSLGGEIALAAWALFVFGAVRGIYGAVPMLFALGIAGCVTFLTWKLVRLFRDRQVAIHRLTLRKGGTLQRAGIIYAAVVSLGILFVVHCGILNFERWCGDQWQMRLDPHLAAAPVPMSGRGISGPERDVVSRALSHYQHVRSIGDGGWGLFSHPQVERDVAWLHLLLGNASESISVLESLRERGLVAIQDLYRLGCAYLLVGKAPEGERVLAEIVASSPHYRLARDRLVQVYMGSGRADRAVSVFRVALATDPGNVNLRRQLAQQVFVPARRPDLAAAELLQAVTFAPTDAVLQHDVAAFLLVAQDIPRALDHMREAVRLSPGEEQYRSRYEELRGPILESEVARMQQELQQFPTDEARTRRLDALLQAAAKHRANLPQKP